MASSASAFSVVVPDDTDRKEHSKLQKGCSFGRADDKPSVPILTATIALGHALTVRLVAQHAMVINLPYGVELRAH